MKGWSEEEMTEEMMRWNPKTLDPQENRSQKRGLSQSISKIEMKN